MRKKTSPIDRAHKALDAYVNSMAQLPLEKLDKLEAYLEEKKLELDVLKQKIERWEMYLKDVGKQVAVNKKTK